MNMKCQAFISYKHSEISHKQAVALEKALKKYAKPLLKPHIKIFRDEKEEIRPGDGLGTAIDNALRNSEYLIYLASKKASKSELLKKMNSYIVRRSKVNRQVKKA